MPKKKQPAGADDERDRWVYTNLSRDFYEEWEKLSKVANLGNLTWPQFSNLAVRARLDEEWRRVAERKKIFDGLGEGESKPS